MGKGKFAFVQSQYHDGRGRSITKEDAKEINSNEDKAREMARQGISGRLYTVGRGVDAYGKKLFTHNVVVAGTFESAVTTALESAKYFDNFSGIGQLLSDPDCVYVFDTVRAVTSRSSESLAKKQLDKWLYYKDAGGRTVEAKSSSIRNRFSEFADDIQARSVFNGNTSADMNDAQITSCEYGLMCCLADGEWNEPAVSTLARQCTKLLARDFSYSEDPAVAGNQVSNNAQELLKAAADLDFNGRSELLAAYKENLQEAVKQKRCSPAVVNAVEAYFGSPEKIKKFVMAADEIGMHNRFAEDAGRMNAEIFSAMADGSFPGFEVPESGSVQLPNVFLASSSGRPVSPKSSVFVSLLADARMRFGKNFSQEEAVGYVSLADINRNLVSKGKDITDDSGKVIRSGPAGCWLAVERQGHEKGESGLYKGEFAPVADVRDLGFRQNLKDQYLDFKKFTDKVTSPVNACGVKTVADYLARLKVSSALHVPLTVDRDTLAAVRADARRMAAEFGHAKLDFEKLNDFWNYIDRASGKEIEKLSPAKAVDRKKEKVISNPALDIGY